MRRLAQERPLGRALPTVLRLSDEAETAVSLATPDEMGQAPPGGCLMVVGHEGTALQVACAREGTGELLREAGGEPLGEEVGRRWAEGRFDGPYLRDSLLDIGVLVETLETATFWSRLGATYSAVKAALEESLAGALVLCHVSHVYETGASLYFTVAARQLDDPVDQWRRAKTAASDAIVAAGATITHHHAIGRDHKPWLEQEVGTLGVELLRAVKERVDPEGVLNPGVLIP
jgi:alkyldihydroxyacetonephosphate synthase